MKPKTMILMGLAIVCGLGASYMTSRLLAERSQPDEQEKVKILVAKRNVGVGERITKPDEAFEVKEVTKDNEPPDALKDFEQIKNKHMKQSRTKGDHVTNAHLYEGGQLDIPEGFQAAAIRVNLETSASGLATLPGSRVNLILTLRGNNIRDTKVITLLENVLVLAADIRVDREGTIAAPSQVVTFALKPRDVSRVAGAAELGPIKLSLRKLHDESVQENSEMTIDEILGIKNNKDKKPAVTRVETTETPKNTNSKVETPVEAPKEVKTFTIYQGGRATDQVQYSVDEHGNIRYEDSGAPVPVPQVAPRPAPQGTPPAGKGPARDF